MSPTIRVRGVEVPPFMYGTAWKEDRTEALVLTAIGAGFRAIDTANQRRHYVEAAVGDAVAEVLRSGRLERADLFLQTKFTYVRGQDHRLPYDPNADFATQVEQSFASSLDHLQTDYVDSYVLHGPWSHGRLSPPDRECWAAMQELQRAGKARLIGVSNVSLGQLRELVSFAEVAPAFVQNRCFAETGWDREVRAVCRDNDIVYQGFSLLTANDRELYSAEVRKIADRHQRSAAEVVFRFAIQIGMLPLTGTKSEKHMRADLSVFDFELEPEEIERIENIA